MPEIKKYNKIFLIVTNIAGSETLEFSPFNTDETTCSQISSVSWNNGYATMIININFQNGVISHICNKSNDSLVTEINKVYGMIKKA